jgi:hypothetical protein
MVERGSVDLGQSSFFVLEGALTVRSRGRKVVELVLRKRFHNNSKRTTNKGYCLTITDS